MLYLRKYKLTVGSPSYTQYVTSVPRTIIPQTVISTQNGSIQFVDQFSGNVIPISSFYRRTVDFTTIPAGAHALSIEKHHFEADIEYVSEANSANNQTAKFRIYNAAPKFRNFVKRNGVIFLKAGYVNNNNDDNPTVISESSDDNLPLIFAGLIERVYNEDVGENIVTTLVCRDTGYSHKTIKASLSFEPLTKNTDVVKALLAIAARNGIPTGEFKEPQGFVERMAGTLSDGLTIEGSVLEELQSFCSDLGYTSYIHLGKLYVEPKVARTRYSIINFNPNNIKGEIGIDQSNQGDSPDSDNGIDGIKFRTPLQGRLTANKVIRITSGQFAGTYKITSLRHSLSYEGQEWDTEISARRI